MSVGKLKDEGNKDSNFSWQYNLLRALSHCCSGMFGPRPEISGMTGAREGVCGQTITYQVVNHSADIVSYTWTPPNHSSIVAGINTESVDIQFDPAFLEGNVKVYATNKWRNSYEMRVKVYARPALSQDTIDGPIQVAAFDSGLNFSIPLCFGATTYTWAFPTGVTIIAGQGTDSIIVDWGDQSGDVTLVVSNSCTSRDPIKLFVEVI